MWYTAEPNNVGSKLKSQPTPGLVIQLQINTNFIEAFGNMTHDISSAEWLFKSLHGSFAIS